MKPEFDFPEKRQPRNDRQRPTRKRFPFLERWSWWSFGIGVLSGIMLLLMFIGLRGNSSSNDPTPSFKILSPSDVEFMPRSNRSR